MAASVQDSYFTYRLRLEPLEEYLRELFPNHPDFNIHILVSKLRFHLLLPFNDRGN